MHSGQEGEVAAVVLLSYDWHRRSPDLHAANPVIPLDVSLRHCPRSTGPSLS